MSIEESVDVDVPVRVAYNQGTQFECFPRFLPGVRRVDRPQPTLTHWVTTYRGITREFDTEVVDQRPDERLAWRVRGRNPRTGAVLFRALGPDRCRLTLRVDHTPGGPLRRAASSPALLRRRIRHGLECFKEFIEGQGHETGTWRGTISGGHVLPGSGQDRPRVPTWPTG
ncbi:MULTISPECIES: SRPBCC family protein [Streptomyces]|uniref:SRPBCC family protein n=1 Tax=Streptomyces lycii TaxID=2654337 RepID=A0ABQ7FF66_9ACTN|nr:MULTISPECIES: SRPBCC family protein [Streptomyces]KAF4407237.1 SRPBCC family protein [Streptomyces lycii]PGH47376.1 cyclase [Streptomyces sp. Ru87]